MLYDPHRRWAPRGICRWEDRGYFFAESGTPNKKPAEAIQQLWNRAKEICAMCPVLQECARDTLGEEYGVYGGLDQHERYRVRKRMSQAIHRWPEARRLAWAEEIHRLRKAGLHWRTIQMQTGIPPSAAEVLYIIWDEKLKAEAPAGAVVDLQLPEEEPQGTPFPERPGRRHAWVRHNGLVADGWYRGETPDGEWIKLTVNSGRGQVNKWVRKADVHLYRPQAVVILHYAERPPDGQEHDLTA